MRDYVKPMMDSEVFAANEYFSACGDSGVVYKFKCDAGGGTENGYKLGIGHGMGIGNQLIAH